MTTEVKFLSLGGIGSVTKNLYVYETEEEILLVDCGLGFADETMLGVDLLLPDVSYLLKTKKRIVGMCITHGHEDHMGALPFILPQLPVFAIYATPFTAALANVKLAEFEIGTRIIPTDFNTEVKIGNFTAEFIRVTHSVPDTSHILIGTPAGNFYHGSDFKFDYTPFDGQKTDFQAITNAGKKGIRCLLSDCLGAERIGFTPSEEILSVPFEREMRSCKGKFIVTTYSSNISRLNQIIAVAEKLNKYVCFIGRSLIKAKDVARDKGLLKLRKEREITADQLRTFADKDVLLFVAGSQGQENSALTRIINGEHRDVKLRKDDVVVFSADPIPGNEISVSELVDVLSGLGNRVMYSNITHEFHVSGHGSSQELLLLMSLVNAQQVLPISGTNRQMVAYKNLAKKFGFKDEDILLTNAGQELIFTPDTVRLGEKIPLRRIYVDQVSGEEVDHYVLRDRQKLSKEGIVAIIAEISAETGELMEKPEIIAKGFSAHETTDIISLANVSLKSVLSHKKPVTDWAYIRKQIRDAAEQKIAKHLRRHPLILPVVIES